MSVFRGEVMAYEIKICCPDKTCCGRCDYYGEDEEDIFFQCRRCSELCAVSIPPLEKEEQKNNPIGQKDTLSAS